MLAILSSLRGKCPKFRATESSADTCCNWITYWKTCWSSSTCHVVLANECHINNKSSHGLYINGRFAITWQLPPIKLHIAVETFVRRLWPGTCGNNIWKCHVFLENHLRPGKPRERKANGSHAVVKNSLYTWNSNSKCARSPQCAPFVKGETTTAQNLFLTIQAMHPLQAGHGNQKHSKALV